MRECRMTESFDGALKRTQQHTLHSCNDVCSNSVFVLKERERSRSRADFRPLMVLDQFSLRVSILSHLSLICGSFLSPSTVFLKPGSQTWQHGPPQPRQSICSLPTWRFTCHQLLQCVTYAYSRHLYSAAASARGTHPAERQSKFCALQFVCFTWCANKVCSSIDLLQ